MTRGQNHYRQNILDDAWIEVFASTNTAMMEYPYILGHPEACSPTLANMANTYIIDSKITDDSVGNEDVLREAERLDADVVTPADVMGDPDTSTTRIVDLVDRLSSMDYDPEVMIPLQHGDDGYTHLDHLDDVRAALMLYDFDIQNHRLSVGGIKDWPVHEQVDAIASVRCAVGDDQYLHGLGFGTSHDWIATLRQVPVLLDSLDMTSVSKDVVSGGQLFTPSADRVDYRLPRGANSTVLSTMFRESVLYMVSYLLGPHPRNSDVPSEITDERIVETLRTHGLYRETNDPIQTLDTNA